MANRKYPSGGGRGKPHEGGYRRQAYPSQQQSSIDMSFMQDGFYQDKDKKIIRETLLSSDAEKCAEAFRQDNLTASQLRRFYGDLKAIQNRVEINEEEGRPFSEVLPFIQMTKAKVVYAVHKKGSKVPKSLEVFVTKCVDNCEDYKDFEAYAYLFEAVVGYAKLREGR